jgi:alpha-amylase
LYQNKNTYEFIKNKVRENIIINENKIMNLSETNSMFQIPIVKYLLDKLIYKETIPIARFGNGNEIVLQGFHWNSCRNYEYEWYKYLEKNAETISDIGFTLVWLPPPWVDDSHWINEFENTQGGKEGYFWRDFDLNSHYGPSGDLLNLTKTFKKLKIKYIFDIVANHRDFNNMKNDKWERSSSCWDTNGDTFMDGSADINLQNPVVYESFKRELLILKEKFGASGFRWDYVRGYSGFDVEKLMNEIFGKNKGISIGELWKDNSHGSYPTKIDGYIDQDHLKNWSNHSKSSVFDYNLKWIFQNKNTIDWRNALCANPNRAWR